MWRQVWTFRHPLSTLDYLKEGQNGICGTDYKSRIIDPAVQESIKMVTAQYTAEELIKHRAAVKAGVEEDITKCLQVYDVIVEPAGLSITNFNFSSEFNAAIEAKKVAQQEAEKQKYILQKAELERQREVTKAKGAAEVAKLIAMALQAQGGSKVLALPIACKQFKPYISPISIFSKPHV